MKNSQDFVAWFRAAAPYIHGFRGHTFVVAFGGEVVSDGKFVALTHDLNLLHSLGVRLVLVYGARPQTEGRLSQRGHVPHYVDGIRVTDAVALECLIEASGTLGVEISALLSVGVAESPMAGAALRVATGNFVTARPVGVVEGVDFQYTGRVRKIDALGIRRRLEDEEFVLLPPLGYSPTGEIYNLTVEEVATAAAVALKAAKLIFLTDAAGVVNGAGELIGTLSAQQAEEILQHPGTQGEDVGYYLPCAVRACRQGVARVHLLDRHRDGALLLELFTLQGIGTLVTPDIEDVLRPATLEDVPGLLSVIEPLEAEGALVKRDRVLLETEIDRFTVLLHDGRVIGCVALYPYPEEECAELACLAVMPEYRSQGRGDVLLGYVAERARALGVKHLFLLSARAGQWFAERGFVETGVHALPPQRQQMYNYRRRSKVFVKPLG
ncbi:amino-acid N-acetyltransferase [Ferrovum sp.]|jgi:amino-acid N-acetyltransferase|uniref:amino-acid N-acetyltransferase n=2 Tax=Ferrovum sp. TaxID=2609467 RepID=UPI00263961D0|nr:amino-acid N-acetyltransferase [Ferrovum sp.]